MPYIKKKDREKVDSDIKKLAETVSGEPLENQDGMLNYIISRLLLKTYPAKYFSYNRAIGMLESCKLEFYRRFVGKYEDKKIKENGDII